MSNKFDRIIKGNFNGLTISLLHSIMDIKEAEIMALPRKIQRTLEREMDSLLRIRSSAGEEFIVNVEWQADNDQAMCRRMLLYHALTHMLYELPVKGIVVYIGKEKMNMPAVINRENIHFTYEQTDLTELDPGRFLKSNTPEEIILAILAGKTRHDEKRQIIKEILFKLRALLIHDEQELNRRVAQLEILGELRDVQEIIKQEEQNMAFTYNLKNDIRYKEGLEKATTERNTVFVLNLLKHTDHSDQKIAELVNVSIDFVHQVKNANSL